MFCKWALAAAVLVGLTGGAARPGFPPPFPPPAPVPHVPHIEGVWYFAGDRRLPAHVEIVTGGPSGPWLIFTNERGQQSNGRFIWGGRGVVATDWLGGLTAQVRGNQLVWGNGTFWTR